MADTVRSLRKRVKALDADLVRMHDLNTALTVAHNNRIAERDAAIATLNARLRERVNPLVEKAFEAHSRSLEALSYTVRAIQNQL